MRDTGLIPGWGRSPGEGNGNPLQYSYMGNPVDGSAWQATVQGAAKESDTTERQSNQQQNKQQALFGSLYAYFQKGKITNHTNIK